MREYLYSKSGTPFEEKYTAFKNEIDAFLNAFLPDYNVEGQKTLGEAMRYSVSAGGKRIRGVLAMAVCELLENRPGDPARRDRLPVRNVVPALACAIEFIHAYSLIHDDMPCMDDDDFRRGKPSCHKVYGEGMAMLAGDALLNLAFEILFENTLSVSVDTAGATALETPDGIRFAKAAAYIARAAGAGGMAGGQAIDLIAHIENEDNIKYMHRLKTGMLFDAAILAPAIWLRACAEDYRALSDYSGALGLAFQLKDDLNDYKDAGTNDKRRNYVTLFGISRAERELLALYSGAINSLDRFSGRADFLRDIVNYVSGVAV